MGYITHISLLSPCGQPKSNGTPHTQMLVSNITVQQKEPGILGKMADVKAVGREQTTQAWGTLRAKNEDALKNRNHSPTWMEVCYKQTRAT